MTMHLHHLAGCAPTPLSHYLKALGILRLVAAQKDPEARGYWQDEHFCLITALDGKRLEEFFLHEYAPTPFVSPWNRGSGFFQANDPGLTPVERSKAPRFECFRAGIRASRGQLAALAEADARVRALKDSTKAKRGMTAAQVQAARARKDDPEFKKELATAERRFKALKADLFTPCLRSWRGEHRRWMDAAVVLPEVGKASWPSLLGTGGADGRLDFTNNAMQRLGDLFDLASPEGKPREGTADLLLQSLYARPSSRLSTAAIGQFFPGQAGGANSTNAPDGESLINPWDFILMLEGAVLFSARATRRLDPDSLSRASAPFAVRAHAAGYASRGRESAERGEQWMPLWSRPTSAPALAAMLGEGRLQLGRQLAHRPIDVARAVSRLGVARGISDFVRFGYLERNGQSKIAVPLGRIAVRERARSRLVDDLAPWLDRLQRLAGDDFAPARLVTLEGVLADSVFNVLAHDDGPERWQAVLLAAAAIENVQASGTGHKAGPIPPLSPEWVEAADDNSAEWRLACALGSAAARYDSAGRPRDSVRHHWLPLAASARRFLEQERRLARDPRVVALGRDPVADCAAVVERRIVEATQAGWRRLPLVAAAGCDADPADLAAFLAGGLDLQKLIGLARGFMALRWERWQGRPPRRGRPTLWPEDAWMAVRLAALPWRLDEQRDVPVDGALVRRLVAGDGPSAIELALRRLRGAGFRPPLQAGCVDAAATPRWAAALAFPISRQRAREMARFFQAPNPKENR